MVDAGVDRLEVSRLVVRLLDGPRERSTDVHRCLDVDDRRERLVVDEDSLGAVLGRRLRLADDERDRLAREDDLVAGERLGGSVRSGGRDREIGRREHGDDSGEGERRAPVDPANARVRLGCEHGPRVEQAVDVAVGCVARRSRHLVRGVEARSRDADQCIAHRLLPARSRGARERSLGDDSGKLASVLLRGETVAEDLSCRDRLARIAVQDERRCADAGQCHRLVLGAHERGRPHEREARRRMLDRRIRGAGARRRGRHDDVDHELLRAECGREGADEHVGEREVPHPLG